MTHAQHEQVGQHRDAHGFLTAILVPADLVLAQAQARFQLPVQELSGKGLARYRARFYPVRLSPSPSERFWRFSRYSSPDGLHQRVMGPIALAATFTGTPRWAAMNLPVPDKPRHHRGTRYSIAASRCSSCVVASVA